jgi:hypothetical protein
LPLERGFDQGRVELVGSRFNDLSDKVRDVVGVSRQGLVDSGIAGSIAMRVAGKAHFLAGWMNEAFFAPAFPGKNCTRFTVTAIEHQRCQGQLVGQGGEMGQDRSDLHRLAL